MKKIFVLLAGMTIVGTSCQKSLSLTDVSNDGDTTLGDGTLLARLVVLSGDSPTDSTVTEYTYNTAGQLIQQHSIGWEPIVYRRDLAGRLTTVRTKSNTGDTAFNDVYYTGSSTQVAYVLYGMKNAGTAPDSLAFTYAGGHVATTSYYSMSSGSPTLGSYQNWTFDGNGNVTKLEVYMGDSTFNIGYDFEYDNKTNPKYAADDARLPVEWGYTLSPNNITKQTNHYSGSPAPDDYVTYTYNYNTASRPVNGVHAGTALGPQMEQLRFYYH